VNVPHRNILLHNLCRRDLVFDVYYLLIGNLETEMNKLVSGGLFMACLGLVSAANAADFEDFARVVGVAPQMEQVNMPRQECRTEYVQVQQQAERGIGGSIIGGLAGGILGNQVGKGNGRTVATAAGAITGAIVGDRMQNDNNAPVATTQPVQQCRTVDHWESRPNGYAVTYEYRGRTFTSVMPYDPGEKVRLHVSFTPQ
jgi:uncharacterized protein YcfJ